MTTSEAAKPEILDDSGLTTESRGQWAQARHRFFKDKLAIFGLVLFTVIILGSVLEAILNPHGYMDLTADYNQPPSWHHLFGTTSIGIDLFSAAMKGVLQDIEIAFIVAIMSVVIGTTVGALAGYYGGKIDTILMRIVDLILVVPGLAILIVLLKPDLGQGKRVTPTGFAPRCVVWTYIARLVRAEFLSLRERVFVEAARALGADNRRIIFKHLVPNCIGTITVNATLTVAGAILLESTLSFLGLGLVPPEVSLGMLVQQGEQAATTQWWQFVFPASILLLIILSVFFIGDGLQSALDPRKNRVRA
jgi:peptide/nickel transport system permease protein